MEKNAVGIVERIADQENIFVEEVRDEIQKAIETGMQSKDPTVQAYWSKMVWQGERPTPEELILYITSQIA